MCTVLLKPNAGSFHKFVPYSQNQAISKSYYNHLCVLVVKILANNSQEVLLMSQTFFRAQYLQLHM
jgi:hypothetical protein